MARGIDLQAEVAKILSEYGDDITARIKDATKEVAKAAAKTVKANSKANFGGTGKYAKGWTSQVETNQYSAQGIIYNKSVPGLPHLLEHGHALRGGGRVPGREHIAPVEREVIESFEKAIERAI